MFKIIGGDQREYGPVSEDQIHQWITEGRASRNTLAQAEGTGEWRPLSSFPEFAEALDAQQAAVRATGPQPQQFVPLPADIDAEALADAVRNRGYFIDVGACLKRAWDLTKDNVVLLAVATSFAFVVMIGIQYAAGYFTDPATERIYDVVVKRVGSLRPADVFIVMMVGILTSMITNVLYAGFYWLVLRLIRSEPARISDLFAGFGGAFPSLVLSGLVVGFFTMIGFMACVIPGIYLSVAWILTTPLIIDRGYGFWEAMELSRRIVTQHWFSMFGLAVVCGLLIILGTLACCVGLLIAAPVAAGALMYAYEDIFRGKGGPGT